MTLQINLLVLFNDKLSLILYIFKVYDFITFNLVIYHIILIYKIFLAGIWKKKCWVGGYLDC